MTTQVIGVAVSRTGQDAPALGLSQVSVAGPILGVTRSGCRAPGSMAGDLLTDGTNGTGDGFEASAHARIRACVGKRSRGAEW